MAKVLVVEDDESFRTMLEMKLRKLGHDVYSAANGCAALELALEHNVDLVITDIIMPEREGLEVILDLRRGAPHIPIIATSGGGRYTNFDALSVATKFGAVCALQKPFTDQDFNDALAAALGKPER